MKMAHWGNTHKGFTLIEVLISLVIAVVGILAMIQLSSTFLQTASNSDQRAVATTIAEQVLENLRGFDGLSASVAGANSFENIESSSTAISVTSGQSTYNFDVVWDVTDYTASGASFVASSSGALYNMYKDVTVTVSWDSPETGNVQLSSIIAGIDPNASALALNDTSLGGKEPQVTHNLGVAPDVIPIQVGGDKFKETSKPLPDVSQHDKSTRVDFEVVTYESVNGAIKEIREEFSTINCQCEFGDDEGSLTGDGETPSYYTWDASTQSRKINKGITVNKVVGRSNLNEQDDLCDRCCRDHHDAVSDISSSAEISLAYDPWRPASGGYVSTGSTYDHKHYDVTGLSEVSPVVGETYIEACRFKRIDGIFYLLQDWKLIDINVMKRDELATSTAISNYGTYVQKVISEYIDNTSNSWTVDGYYTASNARPTIDFFSENPLLSASAAVVAGSTTQLMSRSIYLDEMVSEHRDYILATASAAGYSTTSAAIAGGNFDWLVSIPFYEINTTLLNDWEEGDASNDPSDELTVTNEPIETIVDPDNNFYGTYSRGAVTAGNTSASQAMISKSELGNTSLTGSTPIDPDDSSELLTASMEIILNTSASSATYSGFFDCVAINPKNGNEQKCSGTDYTGITVAMNPATNTSCGAITAPSGNARGEFTCTFTGSNLWTGNITFTHSNTDFSFDKAADAIPGGGIAWDVTNNDKWVITNASPSTDLNVEVRESP